MISRHAWRVLIDFVWRHSYSEQPDVRPQTARTDPTGEQMMQQVKVFKGIESEIQSLEDEVNRWIRQSGANVISIVGNIAPQSGKGDAQSGALGGGGFAPSDVLMIVLYEAPTA